MQRHALLIERHAGRREERIHDGKVMVMRSNLRWCSDGLTRVTYYVLTDGDHWKLNFDGRGTWPDAPVR